VGVVDAGGEIAVHTGSRCLRHAGHVVAADHAALANVARHRGLPEAMSRAFAAATGSPARRLVAALAAGESHGGDLRGRQSASVLVVSGDPRDPPWSSLVDLRVDDHADPLGELARLLDRQEAFGQLSLGLNLLFVGRADAARPHLDAAAALDPDDDQIGFWAGIARGAVDDPGPDWRELRRRIAEAGILQVPSADPQP
jgi:hypothetical protein